MSRIGTEEKPPPYLGRSTCPGFSGGEDSKSTRLDKFMRGCLFCSSSIFFHLHSIPSLSGISTSAPPSVLSITEPVQEISVHRFPTTLSTSKNVPPSPRSRYVPQGAGHLPRSPLRQVRWQMSRMRLLRPTYDTGPHLRRVLVWQLPK